MRKGLATSERYLKYGNRSIITEIVGKIFVENT